MSADIPRPSLALTSQIRWYKSSTPPDDATAILMIVKTENTLQVQPGTYYSEVSEDENGPMWVVSEGCNYGDEYESSEIIGWASEDEIAETACRAAGYQVIGGVHG